MSLPENKLEFELLEAGKRVLEALENESRLAHLSMDRPTDPDIGRQLHLARHRSHQAETLYAELTMRFYLDPDSGSESSLVVESVV